MVPTNVLNGKVVITGLPDEACYTTFPELLQALVNYLGIEIPLDDISNVVIGVSQPGDADRNKLWVRRAPSGAVMGLYTFSEGKWISIFPGGDSKTVQIFWFVGDSRTPPPGYQTLAKGDGTLPSSQFDKLQLQWIEDPTNTYYMYYAAKFVGV